MSNQPRPMLGQHWGNVNDGTVWRVVRLEPRLTLTDGWGRTRCPKPATFARVYKFVAGRTDQ